jgi:hypothetical protein
MLTQTHWKETFKYEPWNPAQRGIEHYTGLPGGYSTFYYNQIPNTTQLMGAEEGRSVGWVLAFWGFAALAGAAVGYGAARVVQNKEQPLAGRRGYPGIEDGEANDIRNNIQNAKNALYPIQSLMHKLGKPKLGQRVTKIIDSVESFETALMLGRSI